MCVSSIWGQLKSYLRRIVKLIVTSPVMTRTDRKWRHRKSWTGNNFPVVFPELLYILGTNNGILNPTNRSPSDIWIPPIVHLLASNSNPTNRRPADFWIPPMLSLLASNSNPTNRRPSDIWIPPMVSLLLNDQSSIFRCTFVYLKKNIFTPAFILTGLLYLVENLYSNTGMHLNPTIIF